MKCHLPGLSQAAHSSNDLGDGIYLVRVEWAQYRWDKRKPHYLLRFIVVEPKQAAGTSISGRLYCTPKALWKVCWFLREFGYDSELLSRDDVDEKHIVGLVGVIKVSHATVHGRTYLNLDAFAPAGQWEDFLPLTPPIQPVGEIPEVA